MSRAPTIDGPRRVRPRLKRVAFTALASAALLVTGCLGAGRGDGDRRPPVEIAIDGSGLLEPLMSSAARRFKEGDPYVEVTVGRSGTEAGFDRFCAGQAAVALASRPMSEEEWSTCKENGFFVRSFPLANHALALASRRELGLECITSAQLRDLWEPGSRVSDLRDLGRSLPQRRVTLVGPPAKSEGTALFTRAVTGGEGRQRDEYRSAETAREFFEAVARSEGGLGYFDFTALAPYLGRLELVAVDGGEGCVRPSRATIRSASYEPLARPLRGYVSLSALRRPKVQAFLASVLERHAELAEAAGLVPMSAEQAERARNVVGEPVTPAAHPRGRGG